MFTCKIKNQKGFSLIEVLMVILVIGIVFTSLHGISMIGTKLTIEAKNRLAATALVNEKMEIVRNLPYDKVGIQGSIDIPGNLPAFETVSANGRSYDVSISARYFDDEMDGTVTSSPVDLIPNDYKIVRVIVSWKDSSGAEKRVSSTSRFVPPGLETNVGGSPLSINVNSVDNGVTSPVKQSSVHLSNSSVSPVIDDTILTDDEGHIMLPAARVSSGNKLTLTKNGYETIETLDATPTFIPIYKHIDVVSNNLNQYSFEQNKLSNLHVKSVDLQNNPIENISFSIEGGKIIGHDDLNNVIFNMPETTGVTGLGGEKIYAGISPGNYNINMDINANYKFVDFEPSVSPAIVPAGADFDYTMRVANATVPSFALTIKDELDGAPVADAEISMVDSSNSEIFSGKRSSLRGVVFYPDSIDPLQEGNYEIKIEASGYATKTEPIDIDSSFKEVVILLTRN